MIDDPSDVMNASQAAVFLGAHIETIRKLARRGEIPCFKLGRDWRFRKQALLRWADGQRAGHGGKSVLVIDDEESVCRAMQRAIGRLGYRVRVATRGDVGLQLVALEAPDLILLDLAMPAMDGPTFLAELRTQHPRLPVVIVTAHPDSDLMTRAMAHAPVMLLAKPVEPKLLERTLHALLGERTESGVAAGGR